MKRRDAHAQRGYNLMELLVAIALLGVVMLAILSLFLWGRKNVYSGKQMTAAISVATKAIEDLAPLTKEDIYSGVFDIAGTATGTTFTIGNPKTKYVQAAIRSTDANAVTGYTDIKKQKTTGPKFLDKWDALVKQAGLGDGAVTLVMMPRADTQPNPRFANSAILQLRVIVSWRENLRYREVILDSTKAN